jgi:ubiquinone/menaquinone biosynthesis C-methylase UbiE
MAIRDLLHWIVAKPAVYEAVQWAVGGPILDKHLRRLTREIERTSPSPTVIDVGGGTGLGRVVWSEHCRYTCVDDDPVKLDWFRHRHPRDTSLLADGRSLPLDDNSVDCVMVKDVTHHVDDVDGLLAECRRVLKPDGTLLLCDAVWRPRRLIARLLWRYDRGANPRTVEALQAGLTRQFIVHARDDFSTIHRYAIWVARAIPPSAQGRRAEPQP